MAFTPPRSAICARPLRPARAGWTAVRNDPAAMERVAVADLGSNSWRLVVFGYEPDTPWWSLVDEIREAVRIGAGMGADSDNGDGRVLRPDRVELALHTAAVYSAFCRATGVDQIGALATSAIRDAANGDELLAEIARTTGLHA